MAWVIYCLSCYWVVIAESLLGDIISIGSWFVASEPILCATTSKFRSGKQSWWNLHQAAWMRKKDMIEITEELALDKDITVIHLNLSELYRSTHVITRAHKQSRWSLMMSVQFTEINPQTSFIRPKKVLWNGSVFLSHFYCSVWKTIYVCPKEIKNQPERKLEAEAEQVLRTSLYIHKVLWIAIYIDGFRMLGLVFENRNYAYAWVLQAN
jgi:hypothetical protein